MISLKLKKSSNMINNSLSQSRTYRIIVIALELLFKFKQRRLNIYENGVIIQGE